MEAYYLARNGKVGYLSYDEYEQCFVPSTSETGRFLFKARHHLPSVSFPAVINSSAGGR